MTNTKKFNLFVFFTMLAKFSVELFMPVILYKLNYSVRDILIFLLLTFIINIVASIPITIIGRKYGFKYLIIASTFLFIGLYFIVGILKKNIFLFIITALFNSITNITYYISRHNYAGIVLEKNKIGQGVGGILIATVLASMSSSILSALMLDRFSKFFLAIIVTVIYVIGILFIYKIPSGPIKETVSLKEISHKINFSSKLFFLLEQFKHIFFSLYPLYVYIFVDNTYTYIGLVYLVTGLASIIFIYFFSRKLDNAKIDYLKLSAISLSSILFLDLLITNKYLALLILFIEGVCIKLFETTVTNVMYKLKDDNEGASYFLYMEILYNIGRIIIITIFLILGLKIRTMLVVCIFFILISGFVTNKQYSFLVKRKLKIKR